MVAMKTREVLIDEMVYIETQTSVFSISQRADVVMRRWATLRRNFKFIIEGHCTMVALNDAKRKLKIIEGDIARHRNLYSIVNEGYSLN